MLYKQWLGGIYVIEQKGRNPPKNNKTNYTVNFWEVDCKPLKNTSAGEDPIICPSWWPIALIDGIILLMGSSHQPPKVSTTIDMNLMPTLKQASWCAVNSNFLFSLTPMQGISLCGCSQHDRLLLQWWDDSHIEDSRLTLFLEWQKINTSVGRMNLKWVKVPFSWGQGLQIVCAAENRASWMALFPPQLAA